jgi:hypothetical protein
MVMTNAPPTIVALVMVHSPQSQHEDRGWRELKEAAETTRCIHIANNFTLQSHLRQARFRNIAPLSGVRELTLLVGERET